MVDLFPRYEGVVVGREGPGVPVLVLLGVDVHVVEVVASFGSTDEQGVTHLVRQGGPEDGVPHIVLHEGQLVHDQVLEGDTPQSIRPVSALQVYRVVARQRNRLLVDVMLGDDLPSQLVQLIPHDVHSHALSRGDIEDLARFPVQCPDNQVDCGFVGLTGSTAGRYDLEAAGVFPYFLLPRRKREIKLRHLEAPLLFVGLAYWRDAGDSHGV